MSENMELSIAQKYDHFTQMLDHQILLQGI